MGLLDRYFEPVFIHDLYSNRVGKGIHAAVRRLAHFMRQATINGERAVWFLQLDVRNFFNSIDHLVLVHEDPDQLAVWGEAIAAFLAERLGLVLKAPGACARSATGQISSATSCGPGITWCGAGCLGTWRNGWWRWSRRLPSP